MSVAWVLCEYYVHTLCVCGGVWVCVGVGVCVCVGVCGGVCVCVWSWILAPHGCGYL